MSAPSDLTLGDFTLQVAPYELVATAFVGEFSIVHRCRDDSLRRDVAVKAVRPDGIDVALARRCALVEARVRASVAHPHVLPLFQLIVPDEENILLVGPWLSHGSLADLELRPVSAAQAVALADALGGALDALHAAGWWHGDLSPGNVLFATAPGDDASPGDPVLADFGTARRVGTHALSDGTIVATPQVTAPEVWSGRPADGRADLYGLGVLLYHALVGGWPFDAADPSVAAELHRHAAVPRPSVGPNVDSVLLRALAKSPAERFPTGAALAAALREGMRADGLLSEDSPPRRPAPRTADARERGDTVVAAGERLEEFAASLDPQARSALRVLLRRSAAVEARAWHEIGRASCRERV